jgi:hypothetical protein
MDYLYARIRECCAQRWDLLVVGGVVGERWARETEKQRVAQRLWALPAAILRDASNFLRFRMLDVCVHSYCRESFSATIVVTLVVLRTLIVVTHRHRHLRGLFKKLCLSLIAGNVHTQICLVKHPEQTSLTSPRGNLRVFLQLIGKLLQQSFSLILLCRPGTTRLHTHSAP